ncbi:MAG: glycosyltransferase family 9 protein [Ferruginibacter sp.]
MPAAEDHILVIRFSAMGDVAMLVPVIKELLQQHPALKVTVLSSRQFAAFFKGIDRLYFIGADLKETHKGLKGIYELYKELTQGAKFTAVADLHNVLRTIVLRNFFHLRGIPVKVIDKGRQEKKALTRRNNKIFRPLKTSHQRYADVFTALGFPLVLSGKVERIYHAAFEKELDIWLRDLPDKIIGVAPFAKHAPKLYPLDRIQGIINKLAAEGNTVVLLGGGAAEASLLNEWATVHKNIKNAAGIFSLEQEMALLSRFRLVITMDSANMHMAAMLGVPVLSIWGATHPYAGFMGYGLPLESAVQIQLDCRPCSVFGNKPCWRGDHACMEWLGGEKVIEEARKT